METCTRANGSTTNSTVKVSTLKKETANTLEILKTVSTAARELWSTKTMTDTKATFRKG